MAADAHFGFFLARVNVAGSTLGVGAHGSHGEGRKSDKRTEHRGQQLVHLASRMKKMIDKNQFLII
ncbi:MAG: hypothetical protein E6Q30_05765 [Aquabacterium sp.]|nr:MAG: hypothetical protein E6Q30_05765 [Aquabacterium sp.]